MRCKPVELFIILVTTFLSAITSLRHTSSFNIPSEKNMDNNPDDQLLIMQATIEASRQDYYEKTKNLTEDLTEMITSMIYQITFSK